MIFKLLGDGWLGIEGLLTVDEMLFLDRLQTVIHPKLVKDKLPSYSLPVKIW